MCFLIILPNFAVRSLLHQTITSLVHLKDFQQSSKVLSLGVLQRNIKSTVSHTCQSRMKRGCGSHFHGPYTFLHTDKNDKTSTFKYIVLRYWVLKFILCNKREQRQVYYGVKHKAFLIYLDPLLPDCSLPSFLCHLHTNRPTLCLIQTHVVTL